MAWQEHVDRIARFLGSEAASGPLYVAVPKSVEGYCGDAGLAGCARSPLAVGAVSSILHELAHLVVVAHFGLATPFWSEGFAESWSGSSTLIPRAPILNDVLAQSAHGVNYSAASHWVQWIEDEYGSEGVAAFLRLSEREDSVSERLEQFEEVSGESYATLQERFWREAPLYYPGFERCGETDERLLAKGSLDLAVSLDCAVDPGPLPQVPNTVYTTRVIEVEATGRYDIVVEPGSALILPCDATDDPVDAQRWVAYQQDIHNSGTEAVPSPLTLRAGRYKLWLVAPDDTPVDMSVTIRPLVSLARIVP